MLKTFNKYINKKIMISLLFFFIGAFIELKRISENKKEKLKKFVNFVATLKCFLTHKRRFLVYFIRLSA